MVDASNGICLFARGRELTYVNRGVLFVRPRVLTRTAPTVAIDRDRMATAVVSAIDRQATHAPEAAAIPAMKAIH